MLTVSAEDRAEVLEVLAERWQHPMVEFVNSKDIEPRVEADHVRTGHTLAALANEGYLEVWNPDTNRTRYRLTDKLRQVAEGPPDADPLDRLAAGVGESVERQAEAASDRVIPADAPLEASD